MSMTPAAMPPNRSRSSTGRVPSMGGRGLALAVAWTLSLLSWHSGAMGQAWVQPAGGYYFKISGSYLSTDEEFNHRGERLPIFAEDDRKTDTSFRDISFTAYVEYGLSPRVTIVGQVPFKILTSRETQLADPGFPSIRTEPTNGGLGDVSLAVRTPLVTRPLALALQGGVKLPLGYEQEPDNGGPPLGTGELDLDGRLAAGLSLYPLPAYLGASIGYRFRGGDLHDELFYDVEAGYTLGPVFMKLRFDALQNAEVDPPDLTPDAAQQPGTDIEVIVGDQDIYKLNPALYYSVSSRTQVGVELFHTFAGKNTTAGTAVSVGVVFTH